MQPNLGVAIFPSPRVCWLFCLDLQNACYSCPVKVIPEFHYNRFFTRILHELLSRDYEDGRATGQPQGVGFRT